MLIVYYTSKKELKEQIGKPLKYSETSLFGAEFKPNGTVTGSNRPHLTGIKGREFFAEIVMKDNLIHKVS